MLQLFSHFPRRCRLFFGATRRAGGRPLCRIALLAFCLAAFGHSASARQASPWSAVIGEHPAAPHRLIAVDKSKQHMGVFERLSPLQLSRVFLCTTGQAVGDKAIEGDLKTPEGIYFVVRHIDSGLEFLKYGPEAYTLNYPNPVDRLRGKTGYGIWIHGRGEPIVPLQTEGCVSMDNNDLAIVAPALKPGTPVALTETFQYSDRLSPAQTETLKTLEQKVHDWAAAWSGRSARFFDFYDKKAYSIAQAEPFSAFQAQKERLFQRLPWIKTTAEHVQVLEGPGYWVTWFYQDYEAPNLTTRGIRRLYWHKSPDGELKILGMEWQPGMGVSTVMAAGNSALPPSDPSSPIPTWPEGATARAVAVAKEKEAVRAAGGSVLVASAADRQTGTSATDGIPVYEETAAPDPQALALARQRIAQNTPQADESGENAAPGKPGTASKPFDLPPPLPAQGLSGAQATAATADTRAPFRPATPPATQAVKPIPPVAAAAPVQTAPVSPAAKPAPVQSAADIEKEVALLIEDWRKEWESGNVDGYMKFYAASAAQGSRRNASAIRSHKQGLWKRSAPAEVHLENIRVKVQNGVATAKMRQDYRDGKGGGDSGLKTLTFEKKNGAWLITREDWSPLP